MEHRHAHHKAHQRVDPEGLALDPHGEHEEHHGHVIVSFWTLTAVLAVLLVFTILTVAASRGEIWASQTFKVDIPQWVNISIALSIATVKGILVLLFFMQLKYDNKVNAVIFSACLFCVALFLGLSMIDLDNRGTIYAFKAGQIQSGGNGVGLYKKVTDPETGAVKLNADGRPVLEPVTGSIVEFAANRYIAEHGIDAWTERGEFLRSHGEPERPAPVVSTANQSRPRRGLTPDLYSETPAQVEGAGHGEH
jgi:cytochrome c oxidase subunit 4